uniref:Uncharacterized protein n=1 Tax=viral metagenome TaxID=1070528 RepID=A0A6C0KWJ6_9ZZZZ
MPTFRTIKGSFVLGLSTPISRVSYSLSKKRMNMSYTTCDPNNPYSCCPVNEDLCKDCKCPKGYTPNGCLKCNGSVYLNCESIQKDEQGNPVITMPSYCG